MKKITLISILILTLTSSAWSLTIGTDETDVGGYDTFLHSGTIGSGFDEEQTWTLNYLSSIGVDTSDFTMYKNEDIIEDGELTYDFMADWHQTNEVADAWAFNFRFTDEPAYFLIKIGTGNLPEGTPDHYLFENETSLDWAVVLLTGDLNIESVINIGRISHLNEFGGSAPVPEPATLMLIGTGLIGMAGFRRKFKK